MIPRAGTAGAHASPRWLEALARVGYVARGVLYLTIGVTALLVAAGLAERARGSADVVRLLARLPLGRLLLAALTVGFVGYSALSLVAAVRAPEAAAADGRASLFVRLGDAAAGVVYAGLAALAVRLLADPSGNAGLAGAVWAARLLTLPGGAVLLGAAGLVVFGCAVYLAGKAAVGSVGGRLERRGMAPRLARGLVVLARAGTAARAALFGVCGWLLLRAAWRHDPAGVGGLGDALDVLDDTAAGPVLVALAGAGCVAYGIYQLAKARFRRLAFGSARHDRREEPSSTSGGAPSRADGRRAGFAPVWLAAQALSADGDPRAASSHGVHDRGLGADRNAS